MPYIRGRRLGIDSTWDVSYGNFYDHERWYGKAYSCGVRYVGGRPFAVVRVEW